MSPKYFSPIGKSRVRHFSQLPKDIDLYFRLTEAMKMDKQIIESLIVT